MRAFVGFLWSDDGDVTAWNWNLYKHELIKWVQSQYLVQTRAGGLSVGFSRLFNNLSDIKEYRKSVQGNELKAIDEFLKFVDTAQEGMKEYFIDNKPHDK